VAAPVVARRIRSGAPVASPVPALVTPAAVPASPARLRMEEREAHPVRPAVREAEAPAGPAGSLGRVALAAWVGPVAAAAPVVDPAARVDPHCAVRAHARAANSACAQAVAARLHRAIRSPMAASVRQDGPIGLSATLHQHRGQAARSRHASRLALSASRAPRRAEPRSPALASRQTSARPAGDAASSLAERSFVSRRDHVGEGQMRDRTICFTGARWLPALAMLAIAVAGGCGSANSTGGDAAAGTSGQAGSAGGGAGGAAGTGGSSTGRGGGGGFAGSAGGGGSGDGCGPGYPVGSSRPAGDGCNVCNCIAPGTWVCSTAACPVRKSGVGPGAPGQVGRRVSILGTHE